jgi:hypothetical protein
MDEIADLEIGLERWSDDYAVALRLVRPDSGVEARRRKPGLHIAIDELRQLADPLAYGRCLGHDFFAHPDIREVFTLARASEGPLRVRLSIDSNAAELNGLRWETLADPDAPEPAGPLLMNDQILFSRYVSSLDLGTVRTRARGDLRALVVVASPSGLHGFAPIDVAAQITRARDGMEAIDEIEVLGEGDRATLQRIGDRLQAGPDIFYLVCHGALDEGESWLWLEDDAGKPARVAGSDLVSLVDGLEQLPRLVVLMSCQSAGTGKSDELDVLGALGPKLAEAGVPAVLAMHGDVREETVKAFVPKFFSELQKDGQIDRAVALARAAVRDHPDAWSPVLYMRLVTGKLWYVPDFEDFEKWPVLFDEIDSQECTPILGPGLSDSLIGSRRQLAKSLAKTYRFPLAPHEWEDLPKVAQFVALEQNRRHLLNMLVKSFRQELIHRLGDDLPSELTNASLNELVVEVGKRRWAVDKDEPHQVLAAVDQKFPVYITTANHSLLSTALEAAGRKPHIELFRWNDQAKWPPLLKETEPDYLEPTWQDPLVYHLFGHIDYEKSLVITEDDYFDFMIAATKNEGRLPSMLRSKLAATGLLFLGFEMDSWDFRVLFRSILDQEGKSQRAEFVHAGVQIVPEEGRLLEIERARKYLETYFATSKVSIYWGNSDDFARDLRNRRGGEKPEITR